MLNFAAEKSRLPPSLLLFEKKRTQSIKPSTISNALKATTNLHPRNYTESHICNNNSVHLKRHATIFIMSVNEKEGFEQQPASILTITRPTPARKQSHQSNTLSTIEDIESTYSHTLVNNALTVDNETASSPLSPFYSHPTTRYSLEAQKSESKLNVNVIYNVESTDLEAGLIPQGSNTTVKEGRLLKSKSGNIECDVWPGRRALKQKKKAMMLERRRNGICGCMAGFSRTTRIWIKVLIVLLVIGSAVAIGLGVSKAVGGGIVSLHPHSSHFGYYPEL